MTAAGAVLAVAGALGAPHAAQGAEQLASADGITGAGTSFDGKQSKRLWGQVSFSHYEEANAFSALFGVGRRFWENIELEVILPLAFGWERDSFQFISEPDGGSTIVPGERDFSGWIGNPYLGVNALWSEGAGARVRAGLGVALPLASWDERDGVAEGLPVLGAGLQDPELWLPGRLSFVGRARAEYGDEYVVALDLAVIAMIVTSQPEEVVDAGFVSSGAERQSELVLQPAFELAAYATPSTLLGVRVPLVRVTREAEAQLSVEPFLRQTFGTAHVALKGTIAVDDPLGPNLDGGPLWRLQLGGGAEL